MSTEEIILQKIGFAFADVQRPSREGIARNSEDLDGREAAARFESRYANQIDDLVEIGITSAEDLYHLTPQAIRYFLPCYLRYVVRHRPYWEYSIVTGLIDFFDRELGVRCGVEYPDFTPTQDDCVLETLRFMEENLDRYALGESAANYRERIRKSRPTSWGDRAVT